VSAYYARRKIDVSPEDVAIVAGTSEAYSFLFKLLANAGESICVPRPSYPLFEHLTRLDGTLAVPYRLEYHGRWGLDLHSVDAAWSKSVRALLAVSPNNPTGSVLTASELNELSDRCADREAALIVDEVFADYPLEIAPCSISSFEPRTSNPESRTPGPEPRTASRALTFRLGGLSKSAGLPQVKLGWIAVDGPDVRVKQALEHLELICDTYLSVSTPVQVGARALIRAGAAVRTRILERVRTNYLTLRTLATSHPAIEVLHADAGWSAVLRVPAARREEDLILELLERNDVVVHPGFFFDFAHEAFLIVSLLPEPGIFAEGVRRAMEHVGA
jgi:aspartate/methionine/tyrosine aminotransferase